MDIEAKIRQMHASGKSRTLAADLLGMKREKLDTLVETMGLDWPVGRKAKTFAINGITDTAEGHAKRLKLSVSSLRWRIKNKLSLSQPLITECTEAEARKFVMLRQAGKLAEAAAAEIGRPYNTLRLASLKFYRTEYQQVVRECKRARLSKDGPLKSRRLLTPFGKPARS